MRVVMHHVCRLTNRESELLIELQGWSVGGLRADLQADARGQIAADERIDERAADAATAVRSIYGDQIDCANSPRRFLGGEHGQEADDRVGGSSNHQRLTARSLHVAVDP